MKKTIYLAIIALFVFNNVRAQNKSAIDTVERVFYIIYTSKDKPPLYTTNYYGDPQRTVTMSPLQEPAFEKVCQFLKVNGMVTITLAPGTQLLTFGELLNVYKIPQKPYSKLPVFIDNERIDNPETILISINQIDNVKIAGKRKSIYIILKGYYEDIKERKKNIKKGNIYVQ
ncbi:hypothetical protein [Mucilaginibacter sp.]|uniref:hypothetical protein n=1 Tax=Mucilaginibacter sp. TaxID=1882438 RepID=UPI0032670139